jgi:hypothetical protein
MLDAQELLANLRQFTGTTQWYKHSLFPNFRHTDGIHYLAEQAAAFWLIDYVYSYQLESDFAKKSHQSWKLRVDENKKGFVSVNDGNENIIREMEIPFTDFPLKQFTLWFVNGVLLLPSEY